jgi:tetratricopeptide (TPR) repeat protein
MNKKQLNIYSLILVILSFLIYSNTINHDYVLDDFSVIKDNIVVKKGLSAVPEIFQTHYRYGYGHQNASLYRPLTLSIFALEWELFPDQPAFAHLINVLAYALLNLLLFRFLLHLFEPKYAWLAFLSCFLFALHPIHTEVVANIKSLDEILAMGLAIASTLLLYHYLDKKKIVIYICSLLLFTLAFFAKESTVAFLIIIPFTLVLFKDYKWSKALKVSSIYLIPFGIYMLARKSVLGSFTGNANISAIDNLLLATTDTATQLATALKILGLYLWKLIFPHPLMNDYSLQQITLSHFGDWRVLLSLIVYALLVFMLVKFWKRNKILTFSIGFYLINMTLYSNIFFKIGTSFGERLLFASSLGFCIALAYLISKPFGKKIQNQSFFKTAKTPLIIILLIGVAYGFKTIERNKAWKDNFSLYSTDVKNCSNSAHCQYYYGLGLMKEKALNTSNSKEKNQLIQTSVQAFSKAIELYPSYSDAYGQRGLAYYRLGQLDAALADYKKAAQFNPGNANALSNMGSLYFQQKNYQEAKKAFERAINANPQHVDALANYASTLGTLGDFNSAITYFKRAAALKPNEPNYYQMIGVTYQNMGNQALANQYLQKAQSLQQNQ